MVVGWYGACGGGSSSHLTDQGAETSCQNQRQRYNLKVLPQLFRCASWTPALKLLQPLRSAPAARDQEFKHMCRTFQIQLKTGTIGGFCQPLGQGLCLKTCPLEMGTVLSLPSTNFMFVLDCVLLLWRDTTIKATLVKEGI